MEIVCTSPTPDDFMTNKTKPIHEVRIGAIKAAIWRNETEAGVRHNVTLSRLYKDGDQWKSSVRIPMKSDTDSDNCRTPIPTQIGQ